MGDMPEGELLLAFLSKSKPGQKEFGIAKLE